MIMLRLLIVLATVQGCVSSNNKTISKQKALEKAKLVLIESYGKEILEQKIFKLEYHKYLWIFRGQRDCPKGFVCKGGVTEIKIDKESGEVICINMER